MDWSKSLRSTVTLLVNEMSAAAHGCLFCIIETLLRGGLRHETTAVKRLPPLLYSLLVEGSLSNTNQQLHMIFYKQSK